MRTDAASRRAKAKVYAEVLLEASLANETVFNVAGELDELARVLRSSFELRQTLANKTVPAANKKALVAEIFAGFDLILLEVFDVMVERYDLGCLQQLRQIYTTLAEQALAAVFVEVTTAVPLDDGLREQIKAKYSALLGQEVLLVERVDANIIGGIILAYNGQLIDASVASQLDNARIVLAQV